MKQKILIVDDEKPLRDMLAKWFRPVYDCQTAHDAEQAIKIIEATPDIALLLTDFKMPGKSGLELAKAAKTVNPHLATVILTAHADVNLVIEAMRNGVDDFFQKPVTDLNVLEERLAKAIAKAALEKEVSVRDNVNSDALENFTGSSPAMEKVYRLIRKVAPTDATVLIEGPSGSGKELTARAIHNLSKRSKGPFVAIECAAISSSLLETELFGSVKGAYTDACDRAGCFETADGGTIFLDEIGEIDLAMQVKLLRVLETHTFQRVGESITRKADFRLITATNKNLLKLVVDGSFREDLYYRLNVIDIHTPALKDHREDIALLAERFLKEFSSVGGSAVTKIDSAALSALEKYEWPGNVRQLRNVIEKMVVLASGTTLTVDDLPEEIVTPAKSASSPVAKAFSTSPSTTLAAGEREQILAALERFQGNKSKAAEALGISRRTIHRKLKEWNLV